MKHGDVILNLYALHANPFVAGTMQHDIHTRKMFLEDTQMGATVCRGLGFDDADLIEYGIVTKAGTPYKSTHAKHPCVLWILESPANRGWFIAHLITVSAECQLRFKKVYACTSPAMGIARLLTDNDLVANWQDHTPFAQAMPEEYHNEDAVQAYRDYYLGDKMEQMNSQGILKPSTWTLGEPAWVIEHRQQEVLV